MKIVSYIFMHSVVAPYTQWCYNTVTLATLHYAMVYYATVGIVFSVLTYIRFMFASLMCYLDFLYIV